MRFRPASLSLGTRQADLSLRGLRPHQIEQSRQVVAAKVNTACPESFANPLWRVFRSPPHRLDPAKRLFDHLSPTQARRVALAARRAAIDRAARPLARYVGADTQVLEAADKLVSVVALVRPHVAARLLMLRSVIRWAASPVTATGSIGRVAHVAHLADQCQKLPFYVTRREAALGCLC